MATTTKNDPFDSDAPKPAKTATPDHTPGNVSKDDQTADASPDDLADAANAVGADQPELRTEEKHPGRVETIQEQGIGPRDPYPTGSPPTTGKQDAPATPNEGVQPLGGDRDKPATPNEGVQTTKKGR